MNLQDLFSMIENKISSGECIKNSIDLIKMYNSIDYKKYVKKNENKYNRTVVFSNKKIELVIITWCNGQSSGYHGHPGECIFKVLENSILEEKLRDHDYKERIYNVGDVGYIDNSIGIHNMIATSDTVTMHIYSPPF